MSGPKELDVPHWAKQPVLYWRDLLAEVSPDHERVTDRMIYARLVEVDGLGRDDRRAAVLRLLDETSGDRS